jgi:hypothetical protein
VVWFRRSSSTSASTPNSASRRLAVAWLASSALAAAIILAASNGHITRAASSDGLVTLYVASHLDVAPADVHPVVVERGTSLRYGRIGMPALIWLASAGRPTAMPWAQAAIVIIAAGAASAAMASLLPGAGLLGALLAFAAPGFTLSIAGGYPEVLAVALALWAVRMALNGRWWVASGITAAALLTRENVVWVLAGLFLWTLFVRRDVLATGILALSVVPAAVWYAFVAARFGHVPPLDPYLRVTTDTVGPPVVALLQSLFRADSGGAAVAAWLHLAAGAAALVFARRSVLGLIAAASALQLLVSGPFAWHFVGHAARTASLLELFVILAVVAALRPAWVEPSALLGEAS